MLVKLYLFILVGNNVTQNGILRYMEKELTTYYRICMTVILTHLLIHEMTTIH